MTGNRPKSGGGPEALAPSGLRRWRLPLAIAAVVLVAAGIGSALLFAGSSSDDGPKAQTGNPTSSAQAGTPAPGATTASVTPSPRATAATATPNPAATPGATGPASTTAASPPHPGNGAPQVVPPNP